ncbi:MAG: DNA gyrase C-terminal beta-propeller domain-containing protein, partial [candidate division WOR-3 bacterium]
KVIPGREILTITENGYGKRFSYEEIALRHRNTGGVKILTGQQKTGNLKKLGVVNEKDEIIILTKNGKVIRLKSEEVKVLRRASMGTKLVDTAEMDQVVDCEIIPHQEGFEEEELF